MVIAPKLQAATQSPQPRQPKPHPVSPAPTLFTAVQVRRPSYSTVRERFAKHPPQRTTATFGSLAATAIPSRSAIFDIHSAPPTGQLSPSILPALAPFMSASAIPEHPGYPHPPQFAPGSASRTAGSLGSSSTANRLEQIYSTTDAMSAIMPKTSTAIRITFIICVFF